MVKLEEKKKVQGEIHYKLRADCYHDVKLLIEKLPRKIWGIKIEQDDFFPDVDFEFKSALSIDELKTIMVKQEDSHVMIETLKPIDEYTGERTYITYEAK